MSEVWRHFILKSVLTLIRYVFPGESVNSPVYTVDRITHRDNAILSVSNSGRMSDETVSTHSCCVN